MGTLSARVGWKEDSRGLGMTERCWGSGFLWETRPCGKEQDPGQGGGSGKDSPGGGIQQVLELKGKTEWIAFLPSFQKASKVFLVFPLNQKNNCKKQKKI